MAHVKVVRRSMRPEEWTDLRFTWLQRGIWADEEEITGLRVRDAHQISENAYEFVDGEERPLNRGDMMFTPDGTAFIRGTANIPERFAGQRVYLRLHTAAEMIVRVNGKLVGGIDPNRDAILLTPYIDRPELTIEIEAYNRSKPDDERNPASLSTRGCRQIFEGVFLCTRRDNVQSLVYEGPVPGFPRGHRVCRRVFLETFCQGVGLVLLDGLEPAGNLASGQGAEPEGNKACNAHGAENAAIQREVHQDIQEDASDGNPFCECRDLVVGGRERYRSQHKAKGNTCAHVTLHRVVVKEGRCRKERYENSAHKDKPCRNAGRNCYAPPV